MGHTRDTQKTKRFETGRNTWSPRVNWVYIYLAAIVTANLLLVKFGPKISILTSFFFIGLDLTSRDRLHESWSGRGLVWRMALLIGAGSLLTWIINREAGLIARASFLAFAASATVDSIFYYFLREKSYLVKVNGSNVFGAAVDSLLFPWLAFGSILPWITAGQFLAKIGGGFVWSLIIEKMKKEKP